MELSQLRYFVAVAEARSISRAAQLLRIAQPAVSRQIRNLELELRQTLFARSERGAELTIAGQQYLDAIKPLLRELDEANDAMRSRASATIVLHLGIVQLAQWYPLVTDAITSFRESHANTRLEVRQMPSSDQVRALMAREIDVAIGVPISGLPKDMESITLFTAPRGIVLSNRHELAQVKDIDLGDLERFPLITTAKSTWTGSVSKFFSRDGEAAWTPDFTETFDNLSLLLSRLRDDASIAIIPQLGPDAPLSGLLFRKVEGIDWDVELAVYWRSQEQPKIVSDFIALFKSR